MPLKPMSASKKKSSGSGAGKSTGKNASKSGNKSKQADDDKTPTKLISDNRRARFEYELFDVYQAGIELTGTEVKSMRAGKANLQDSFARVEGNELWLYNMNVSPYEHGNRFNHEPTRRRKLLVHAQEIGRIRSALEEKGLTLVPLKLYFKRNWVKVDLAVARGRRLYDKREAIKKRESDRRLRRLVG
jgi:SsrA-binding protein